MLCIAALLAPGAASAATATDISMGDVHTCAVMNDHTVKCWGQNTSGELGNNSLVGTSAPVPVSGIANADSVTLGAAHSCALLQTQTVKCWGNNAFGQLGDGTTTRRLVPVSVSISGVTQLEALHIATCALKADQTVWCWGETFGSTPTQVSGISTAVAIMHSSGWHGCAVLADSSMKCWGFNNSGQLGNGNHTNARPPNPPVVVSSISTASSATGGAYFTCAALSTNAAKCWGSGTAGQLGNGAGASSDTPVSVSSPSDISRITAGESHACLLTSTGAVKCWGQNNGYQIGDGTTTNRPSPVPVSLAAAATDIAAGYTGTCAIDAGAVDCWGTNAAGDNTQYSSPYRMIGSPNTPTVTFQSLNGAGSARIAYSAPYSRVTSASITCASSDGGATQTATGSSSPVTVSGLSLGKTYTCTGTASNDDGTSSPSAASGAFISADLPGAPTITNIASSGANALSVSFALGAANGAAIDSTQVTCSGPGGATQTASGTSPVIVSGLTEGIAYSCTAASSNAAGTGPSSNSSVATLVEGAPGTPAAPSVAVAGMNTVRVTVTPPAANGPVITSYAATCSSTDGGTTRSASTATPTIVVSSLSAEASYTCTATATNTWGTSAASAASSSVRALVKPDAPSLSRATVLSSGRVMVYFNPADTGGWTTLYAPICLSTNGGMQKTKIDSSSPIVVGDLTPRATYTCKVFASNAAGSSDYSAESQPIYIRPVGVTINDEATYTNTPSVQLRIGWPAGAVTMSVSNDGGFNSARSFVVGETIPWTLASSGPERLPKTVYVRFAGFGVDPNQTYQDDVILDEKPPTLSAVTVTLPTPMSSRAKHLKVRVKTSAKDAISGVSSIQIASTRTSRAKSLPYAKIISTSVTSRTVWVRVSDGAGNWSEWRKANNSEQRDFAIKGKRRNSGNPITRMGQRI